MNNDLISRSELRKAFKKCPVFTEAILYYARQLIDDAPAVNPFTDPILEAYSKICDQEFEHSNEFWIITPKGKKIYFEKKRPHGEWMFKHNSSDVWCSNCDISLKSNLCEGVKFSYCPNCGADMRGGKE